MLLTTRITARKWKAVGCLCAGTGPWDAAGSSPIPGVHKHSAASHFLALFWERRKGKVDKMNPAASLAEVSRISVTEEW